MFYSWRTLLDFWKSVCILEPLESSLCVWLYVFVVCVCAHAHVYRRHEVSFSTTLCLISLRHRIYPVLSFTEPGAFCFDWAAWQRVQTHMVMSDLFKKQNKSNLGWRWQLSGYMHWPFFPKSWFNNWHPLTSVCNTNPRGSYDLFWPLKALYACGAQVHLKRKKTQNMGIRDLNSGLKAYKAGTLTTETSP